MLENFFDSSRTIKRFRQGILGPYLDNFADELSKKGYARHVIREYVRMAAHWSRYAVWCGLMDISCMTHTAAQDFIDNHLPNCTCERMNNGKYANAQAAIARMLEFLVDENLIATPPHKLVAEDSCSIILAKYDRYLDSLFGLCQKTRNIHMRMGRQFNQWLIEKHGILKLDALTGADILEYQEECYKRGFSHDWRKTLTSCLRAFLRFLLWERILALDLTDAVYTIREWKYASLPRYMPFESVMRILAAPDRSTPEGKRDMTMLMLLAYLGLRACEVINLCISDVDFQNNAILIRKTKTQKERILPLPGEIAEVMSDYICNGRKPSPAPKLFLKNVAPYTPLSASSAAGAVVKKYIQQTGIQTPTFGTHQFRHSLATHLLNNGSTLKDIADLLGHNSLESTCVYAKVQYERLKEVPLAFPLFSIVGRCAK